MKPRTIISLTALLLILSCCVYTRATTWAVRPIAWEPPIEIVQPLWKEVVVCAGTNIRLGVSLENIKWYRAKVLFELPSGRLSAGLWTPPHSIYIDNDYLDNVSVIKHELLHEAFGVDVSHDNPLFKQCDSLY